MRPLLSLERRRRYSNVVYVVLASFAFLLALVPLISILYATLLQGYAALSFDFFTKVTPPIGGTK